MQRSSKQLLLGAVVAVVAILAATAGLGGSLTARAATSTVNIQAFKFVPASATVAVGDTVKFVNLDAGVSHSATSDNGVAPAFDTGTMTGAADGSANATITFATAGTYAYHCKVHPSMTGTIVVQAQATSSATSTTTATATATASVTASPTATATATATTPPPTNAPCNLTVADQNVGGALKELVIARAQQARAGYVAIHENSATNSPGAVIGASSYLAAGSDNAGLKLTLDRPLKDGEKVWAMLHTENNGNQTYDGATVDKPTIEASCGNSALANIVTFPLTVKVTAPAAPATGSGVSGSNDSSPARYLAAAFAAVATLAGAAFVAVRRRAWRA